MIRESIGDRMRAARKEARARGHAFVSVERRNANFLASECRRCGMHVYVQRYPEGDHIEVSGAAAALQCAGEED